MDFDNEAADDFTKAVKKWELDLSYWLSRAGADFSDCESDNGLLTPPPDYGEDLEKAWDNPPLRPTYADSWIRVMKQRVDEGCTSSTDQYSDTSSVSSCRSDTGSWYNSTDYILPIDAHSEHHLDSNNKPDALAFSDDSFDREYLGGSAATTADAEDLFEEMIAAYTVPKELKTAITHYARTSAPKRKQSSISPNGNKPLGISKRTSRSSLRSSRRSR